MAKKYFFRDSPYRMAALVVAIIVAVFISVIIIVGKTYG